MLFSACGPLLLLLLTQFVKFVESPYSEPTAVSRFEPRYSRIQQLRGQSPSRQNRCRTLLIKSNGLWKTQEKDLRCCLQCKTSQALATLGCDKEDDDNADQYTSTMQKQLHSVNKHRNQSASRTSLASSSVIPGIFRRLHTSYSQPLASANTHVLPAPTASSEPDGSPASSTYQQYQQFQQSLLASPSSASPSQSTWTTWTPVPTSTTTVSPYSQYQQYQQYQQFLQFQQWQATQQQQQQQYQQFLQFQQQQAEQQQQQQEYQQYQQYLKSSDASSAQGPSTAMAERPSFQQSSSVNNIQPSSWAATGGNQPLPSVAETGGLQQASAQQAPSTAISANPTGSTNIAGGISIPQQVPSSTSNILGGAAAGGITIVTYTPVSVTNPISMKSGLVG